MKKLTSYSLYLLLTISGGFMAESGSASASTLVWDPSQTHTGSDGSGTWTATSTNWALNGSDTDWGTTYVNVASIGDGGTAGTITLGSNINLLTGSGITFNAGVTGSYLITYSSNYQFLAVNGGTATITVNAAAAEIDAGLGDSSGPTTIVVAGTGILTLGGATNDSYLQLNVDSGSTVVLDKTSGGGVNAVAATTIYGTLQLAGTGGDQIYNGNTSVHAYSTLEGGGVFDMNGRSETINGITVNNGGVSTLTNNGGAASTLTMEAANTTTQASEGINLNGSTGSNGNNLTVSGTSDITIVTGAGVVGTSSNLLTNINGSDGVIKNGTNTLNLTGPNTYTGSTEINSGKLSITNTSGSATGSGEVDVNGTSVSVFGTLTGGNSGTLVTLGTGSNIATLKNYTSGAGAISGPVVVNQFAHLDAGVSGVGSLSVGALTLNSGAVLDYQFSGTANSLTFVTGYSGLTLNGGTVDLYQAGTSQAFDTIGVYNLLSYTGPDNGSVSDLIIGNMQSGFDYSFVDDTHDGLIQLDITASAVPEPGTGALMLGGLATLFVLVYKRRKLS